MSHCKHCNKPLGKEARPNQIYCNKRCKSNAQYQRKKEKEKTMLHGTPPSPAPALPVPSMGMDRYSDTKSYIIYDLENKYKELKERNDKLERENEELRSVNRQQEKDLSFIEKEHEFQLKELETNKSNSLGGIVKEVSQNENVVNLLGVLAQKVLTTDHQQLPAPSTLNPWTETFDNWFKTIPEKEKKLVFTSLMLCSEIPFEKREAFNKALHQLAQKYNPTPKENETQAT